jgi:hypothetical protein
MENILLLLQVVSIGLTIYVLLEIKKIFREVRNPVIRQKNQLPGDFKDRLRNLPRPDGQARENREGNRDNRENRGDRPQGNRDGNRDGRDRDRNRDGRDRDRNRDGNRENRGDRPQGDRPQGNRDGNRDGRDRDRNRDGNRDNRGDRPREPRPESAPVAATEAPAVAAAPSEGAPFSGRRPLPSMGAPSAASAAPVVDALAPTSLAQPVVNEGPRSFGRRQIPKAKPRFDEDDATESSEEKSETTSA